MDAFQEHVDAIIQAVQTVAESKEIAIVDNR